MTVISGASAGVKDLADGSLRITIEFEPRHAKEAFELFGSRGTPVALAALREGFAAVPDVPKEKPGPLCREAVDLCKMPEFQQWAAADDETPTEAGAKLFILTTCEVDSRKKLDTFTSAAKTFIERVRIPFMRYMQTRLPV